MIRPESQQAAGSDGRLAAVRSLLEREGIEAAVSVAGRDGDIVAITASADRRPLLTALASEIRSAGFRYVALEPREGIEENRGS